MRTFQQRVMSMAPEEPPTPPPKDKPSYAKEPSHDLEDYLNSLGRPSRPGSVYSITRNSFSKQLSGLTSITLPDANDFSQSISKLSTALEGSRALTNSARLIQQWIVKAAEVLAGLEAEDDVEWAAAGGRDGLASVDTAVAKFEQLVGAYVTAIEELQERKDIAEVPTTDLNNVVEQMEKTLAEWENVRRLQKSVKEQVELAMEWEELWDTVLGDISTEMEHLEQLVFEMEERRHRTMKEAASEPVQSLDLQELETIVEKSPMAKGLSRKAGSHFSLPPAFQTEGSPLNSPGLPQPQDDPSLLALFARMQPLRASLDFLPMRLSNFQPRAEAFLPTACTELKSKARLLEKKWKALEGNAEGLRRELAEDRWVLVFRNAGRQVEKMCESIRRSLIKVQEIVDTGAYHANPPTLAKRVENFEAKKSLYGPAIQRVIAIIERGVKDRLTVNGEILRLHADTHSMWSTLEADIRSMDAAIEEMSLSKSQQLRDSISTIMSANAPSAAGSAIDTPGSSPASSIAVGPTSRKQPGASTPHQNGSSRRSSIYSTSSSRPPAASRRNVTMPTSASTPAAAHPRPTPRSVTTTSGSTHRTSSPYRAKSRGPPISSTPTPHQRPSLPTPESNKPRWNSSSKIDYSAYDIKSLNHPTPSPHARNLYPLRSISRSSQRSFSSNLSNLNHYPSPLGRESSASPSPSMASNAPTRSRSRLSSTHNAPPTSNLAIRSRQTQASPSPASSARGSLDLPRPRQYHPTAATPLNIGCANTNGSSTTRPTPTSTKSTPGGKPAPRLLSFSQRRESALANSSKALSSRNQPSSPLASPREYVETNVDEQEVRLTRSEGRNTGTVLEPGVAMGEDSPSLRGLKRPVTSLGGKRMSMLPVPVGSAANYTSSNGFGGSGRDSVAGRRSVMR